MRRIVVDPDQLRILSTQLQQVSQDLHGVAGRVSGAWNGLDWEARQRSGLEGQVNSTRSQANALAV